MGRLNRYHHRTLLGGALLLVISLTDLPGASTYKLADNGAFRELTAEDRTIGLDPSIGGFFAREVGVEGAGAMDFSEGTLRQEGAIMVYDSESRGIGLHAEFIPKKGYVRIEGYLENTTGEDRAIILDYRVGLTGSDMVFSNALNRDEEHAVRDDATEHEGNAFPVAALQTADQAIAAAIPVDAPCIFGMVGSAQGLSVRFYLGLTPQTRAFPNRARFALIIYPSRPDWGFRSALERYYTFFPENYEPRDKRRAGYYMYMVKGLVPENIEQYSFNVLEIHSPHVQHDLDRDDKHDIISLLYTLVGQREIKFLDELPANYDEAMTAFSNWTIESHLDHPVTKENAVAGADRWLREEVKSSGVKGPKGKYVLLIRDTPWGKKSVSFKVNPSPYLFADRDIRTVGKTSTVLIRDWLKEYPQIDGVIVDSLGANWPATANYRRDHMKYAQFPVTFDHEGRLFVHNQISHYEWIKYMREEVLEPEQYLSANGVYAYRTRNAEHYRVSDRKPRIKVGRFFMSSLLDGGASEAGTRASVERYQDVRIMFGRKYYALTNYEWEDEEKVKQFYNRALAFGVFASNTKNYFGGGEYVEHEHEGVIYADNPDGYYRDKELINWFLPKAEMLHEAGWEPETFARIVSGGEDLYIERFGEGNSVYLTIFNDSPEAKECTVKIDLARLGFTEGDADIQELAYDAELEFRGTDTFQLTAEPYHTYIVSLTKTWMWGWNRQSDREGAELAALTR